MDLCHWEDSRGTCFHEAGRKCPLKKNKHKCSMFEQLRGKRAANWDAEVVTTRPYSPPDNAYDDNGGRTPEGVAYNIQWATQNISEASRLLLDHGWWIKKCTDIHYQCGDKAGHYLYNIYPSKFRIWADNKKNRTFLPVDSPWTLLDIANAIVEEIIIPAVAEDVRQEQKN